MVFCSPPQPVWDITIHSLSRPSVLADTRSFLQSMWDPTKSIPFGAQRPGTLPHVYPPSGNSEKAVTSSGVRLRYHFKTVRGSLKGKIQRRQYLLTESMGRHIKTENEILSSLNFPFQASPQDFKTRLLRGTFPHPHRVFCSPPNQCGTSQSTPLQGLASSLALVPFSYRCGTPPNPPPFRD